MDQKRYESEISAILQTFERAREWADLTSCLNRLHKCLSRAPPTLTHIPFSGLVAKRLGQCLNPALPAGVHGKCLEVYEAIFSRIGTDGLARDLGLWTPILFPIFGDAATHIKPLFLDLVDAFYIPLKASLMPCLTGLLVCLLPGVDPGGGAINDRVKSILRTVADVCVGQRAFFAALWIVIHRTSRVRLTALQVLSELMPSVPLAELPCEEMEIYLPNRDMLVMRALENVFSDPNVLVRRHLFDFLVVHLPLDTHMLFLTECKMGGGDVKETVVDSFFSQTQLLRAAFQVVSLTEWSVTRRFLQWITGQTDLLDGIDISFFKLHVRNAFCAAIRYEFEESVGRIDSVSTLTLIGATPSDSPTPRLESLVRRNDCPGVCALKVLKIIFSEVQELTVPLLEKLTVFLWRYATFEQVDFATRQAVMNMMRPLFTTTDTLVFTAVWNALDNHFEDCLGASEDEASQKVLEALRLSWRLWEEQWVLFHAHSAGMDIPGITICDEELGLNGKDKQLTRHQIQSLPSQDDLLQPSAAVLVDVERIAAQSLRALSCLKGTFSRNPVSYVDLLAFSAKTTARAGALTKSTLTERLTSALDLFLTDISSLIALISECNKHRTPLADKVCTYLGDILLFAFKRASSLGQPDVLVMDDRPVYDVCGKWLSESLAKNGEVHNVNSFVMNNGMWAEASQKGGVPPWFDGLASSCLDYVIKYGCWKAARVYVSLLSSCSGLCEAVLGSTPWEQSVFYCMAQALWDGLLLAPSGFNADEAAGLLLQMDELERCHLLAASKETLKSFLVAGLSHHAYEERLLGFQKFAIFWEVSHRRDPKKFVFPQVMHLVLDCLDAPEPPLRYVCRSWLTQAVQNFLPHVVDPVFEELLNFARDFQDTSIGGNSCLSASHDPARTVYLLTRLTTLIRSKPCVVLHAFCTHPVTDGLLALNWASTISARKFEFSPFGYEDGRCVVDYLDLSCVLVARLIQPVINGAFVTDIADEKELESKQSGMSSEGVCRNVPHANSLTYQGRQKRCIHHPHRAESFFDQAGYNIRVQSAASEFVRVLLEAGPSDLHQRWTEMRCLLVDVVLRVFYVAMWLRDATLVVQTLEVLKLVVPFVIAIPVPIEVTIAQTTSRDFTEKETDDTSKAALTVAAAVSNVEAICEECKQQKNAYSSSFAEHVHTKTSKLLYRVLLRTISTVGAYSPCQDDGVFDHGGAYASDVLSALTNFLLSILPLYQDQAQYTSKVYMDVLLHWLRVLGPGMKSSELDGEVLAGCDAHCGALGTGTLYLLRGFSAYLNYLMGDSGGISVQNDRSASENTQPRDGETGGWLGVSAMLPGWWSAAASDGSKTSVSGGQKWMSWGPNTSEKKAALVARHVCGILLTLSMILERIEIFEEERRELSGGLFEEDVDTIKSEVRTIVIAMLNRYPTEVTISCALCLTTEAKESTTKLLENVCRASVLSVREPGGVLVSHSKGDTSCFGCSPILRLMQTVSKVLFRRSIDCVPAEVPPLSVTMQLDRQFVVRESVVLNLVYTIIVAAAKSDDLKAEAQDIWTVLFTILQDAVTASKEPMTLLWLVGILQRMDFYQPAKDTTLSATECGVKKARKHLAHLSKAIANVAVQQFEPHRSVAFDVNAPRFPIAMQVLEEIRNADGQRETEHMVSGVQELAQNGDDSFSVDDTSKVELSKNMATSSNSWVLSNPLAFFSNFALASIVLLNYQVKMTRKRTAVGAAIVCHIAEEYSKTILSTALRSCSDEAYLIRYLGWLYVYTLPSDLLPASCLVPCKRLLSDFIVSPAFGGSSTNLFSQISMSASEGAQLFKGMDRQSLRALAGCVRIAVESDSEAPLTLADTLTIPQSTGMFSSKESDLWRRARELKRLSFLTLAFRRDFFVSRLSAIAGRIVESLKLEAASAAAREIYVQAFLCLRVLFVKVSSQLLSPYWPILLPELTRVFSLARSAQNLPLLLAALKVVDLAILLDLPDFHLYQWVFTGDTPIWGYGRKKGNGVLIAQSSEAQAAPVFESLCYRLAQHDSGMQEAYKMSKDNSQELPKSPSPLFGLEASATVPLAPAPIALKRRPLITQRTVSDASELMDLASRFNAGALQESIASNAIDYTAVLRSIENDLLDVTEDVRDMLPNMENILHQITAPIFD